MALYHLFWNWNPLSICFLVAVELGCYCVSYSVFSIYWIHRIQYQTSYLEAFWFKAINATSSFFFSLLASLYNMPQCFHMLHKWLWKITSIKDIVHPLSATCFEATKRYPLSWFNGFCYLYRSRRCLVTMMLCMFEEVMFWRPGRTGLGLIEVCTLIWTGIHVQSSFFAE